MPNSQYTRHFVYDIIPFQIQKTIQQANVLFRNCTYENFLVPRHRFIPKNRSSKFIPPHSVSEAHDVNTGCPSASNLTMHIIKKKQISLMNFEYHNNNHESIPHYANGQKFLVNSIHFCNCILK